MQPAYGRWRFVTHLYVKQWLIRNENALQSYVDEAIENCYLAACPVLKGSCPDHRIFLDTFGTQITEIMDEAAKLRTNMQEKLLTANYEPYLPAPGARFKLKAWRWTRRTAGYRGTLSFVPPGLAWYLPAKRNARTHRFYDMNTPSRLRYSRTVAFVIFTR